MTKEDEIVELDIDEFLAEEGIDVRNYKELYIWNDDINSFEHAITSLIQICKLNPQTATVIAVTAHENGKALVLEGPEKELIDMKRQLNDRNLEATVE